MYAACHAAHHTTSLVCCDGYKCLCSCQASADSTVGFLNFDIDTTMNTGHKPNISEWRMFCDQTSQFECGDKVKSIGTFTNFCIHHSINV